MPDLVDVKGDDILMIGTTNRVVEFVDPDRCQGFGRIYYDISYRTMILRTQSLLNSFHYKPA